MKLEVQGLSVAIGKKTILRDISFTLQDGWWLMIAGPNGAGKTTLLRAVSQALPSAGAITLDGQDMRKLRPVQIARRIGFMEQLGSVEFAFSVEEVVSMGRYAHRKGFLGSDPDAEKAVDEALRITHLEGRRKQSVLSLSGGELQRVMLAQVLCQQPDILFLDEPANHLDLKYQKELFTLIDEWRQVPGHAVISVVHDLSLGRKYATHALLLNESRQIAFGEARDVLTDERLNGVWQMDVAGWFRELGEQWR